MELTLAISIILSNLSHNKDFIESLLGVDQWHERKAALESHDQPANKTDKSVESPVNRTNQSSEADNSKASTDATQGLWVCSEFFKDSFIRD